MEDKEIIELYFNRDEKAIRETAKKYGAYCNSIAHNILDDWRDCEECVNDAYLKTWQSIPPCRPNILSAYIGKIVRNLAFDKYNASHAQKRGGYEVPLVLDELAQIVSVDPVEEDKTDLTEAINSFLRQLPKQKRQIMVSRYWYCQSVKEIAQRFEMSDNQVSVTLNRLRNKLKQYLTKEGFKL